MSEDFTPGVDGERRYFRVEDTVLLDYRESTPEELRGAMRRLDLSPGRGFSLTAAFDTLTQEARFIKQKVRATNQATAQYIDLLERKIDMLAQAILPAEIEIDDSSMKDVSLSAGGLAFSGAEPVPEDAHLEIKLVLLPARLALLLGARVVYCRKEAEIPERRWAIATEFTHIREGDRQILVKHVLARQADAIRRAAAGE